MIETGNDKTIAAINPGKTELVVAIINKSDQPKPINLNLKAFKKSGEKVQIFRTSLAENCSAISGTEVKKQSLSYSSPGLSLTTFVIPLRH